MKQSTLANAVSVALLDATVFVGSAQTAPKCRRMYAKKILRPGVAAQLPFPDRPCMAGVGR
jgi:hypothetical protein